MLGNDKDASYFRLTMIPKPTVTYVAGSDEGQVAIFEFEVESLTNTKICCGAKITNFATERMPGGFKVLYMTQWALAPVTVGASR